jgi:hypothetical protein
MAPLHLPQVLEQLLQLLLKASTERIEALLLAKELDHLGALQLDRELRTLSKVIGLWLGA